LQSGYILAYRTAEKAKDKKGQISITGSIVKDTNETDKPFSISVTPSEGIKKKTYYLSAASKEEFNDWLNALQKAAAEGSKNTEHKVLIEHKHFEIKLSESKNEKNEKGLEKSGDSHRIPVDKSSDIKTIPEQKQTIETLKEDNKTDKVTEHKQPISKK